MTLQIRIETGAVIQHFHSGNDTVFVQSGQGPVNRIQGNMGHLLNDLRMDFFGRRVSAGCGNNPEYLQTLRRDFEFSQPQQIHEGLQTHFNIILIGIGQGRHFLNSNYSYIVIIRIYF